VRSPLSVATVCVEVRKQSSRRTEPGSILCRHLSPMFGILHTFPMRLYSLHYYNFFFLIFNPLRKSEIMNSCANSSSFINGCTFVYFSFSLLNACSLDTSFIFNFMFYTVFIFFIYLLLLSSLFLSKHTKIEILMTIILLVRVILDVYVIWSLTVKEKYFKY
jgi:hypothetical protein